MNKILNSIVSQHFEQWMAVSSEKNNNWSMVFDSEGRKYLIKIVEAKDSERLKTEAFMTQFMYDKFMGDYPRVLFNDVCEGYCYLIRTYTKAIILGQVEDDTIKRSLHFDVGRQLADLHSHSFEVSGVINEGLKVTKSPVFTADEFKSAINCLVEYGLINDEEAIVLEPFPMDELYAGPYNLCHGDFAHSNILASENHQPLIIDFEWALSAAPYDDLITFDLFTKMFGNEAHLESFYKGYTSLKEINNKYWLNKDLYKFYRIITMLSYQLKQAEEDRIQPFMAYLQKELSDFEFHGFKEYVKLRL